MSCFAQDAWKIKADKIDQQIIMELQWQME
jgi:hypothetical protein